MKLRKPRGETVKLLSWYNGGRYYIGDSLLRTSLDEILLGKEWKGEPSRSLPKNTEIKSKTSYIQRA